MKPPRAKSPRFLSKKASFRRINPWTKSPGFSADKNKLEDYSSSDPPAGGESRS